MTPTNTDAAPLDVTRDGAVMQIRLNNPSRRNALHPDTVPRFVAALEEAGRDDSVRAVLITAAGDHFCSGMDLARDRSAAPKRPTAMHRSIDAGPHRIVELIASIEVPVVTAVRGHAAGLGVSLALAADFPVISETAIFTVPFVARGFTPDSGSTFILPRAIGAARAREMLMLGRRMSAVEAERWGAVSRVVADDALDDEAADLAATLAAGATTSLGLVKWLLARNADASLSEALRHESLVEDISTRTSDFKAGVAAFLGKTTPEYTGS